MVLLPGWHWEEKNRLEWSKQHLKTVLEGLEAGSGDSQVSISSVKSVTGEVSTWNLMRDTCHVFWQEQIVPACLVYGHLCSADFTKTTSTYPHANAAAA